MVYTEYASKCNVSNVKNIVSTEANEGFFGLYKNTLKTIEIFCYQNLVSNT